MKNSRYELLKGRELLTWSAIEWALKAGKIGADDVADFAVEQMAHDDDLDIAILAGLDRSDEGSRLQILERLSTQAVDASRSERWLLAALLEIQETTLGDEEKIAKLQDVFAEFGYPERLEKCSIYYNPPGSSLKIGEKAEDPLVEMERAIQTLLQDIQK